MRSIHVRGLAATATILVGLATTGCPGPVDQRALDGVEAFRRCDMRGARDAFSEARDLDTGRADVALGFALSDLALLVEDPALQALAPRVGFDGVLDSELLWGREGVLELLSSESASCDDLGELLRTRVPHPSARSGGPSLLSTWDATLTIGDARATLVALLPRIRRIEDALVVAAAGMGDDDGVTLEGGCGIAARPTRVQAPELLALATALATLDAAVQLTLAYDGDIPAVLLFSRSDDYTGWAAMMNAHLLHPTDPSSLPASREALRRAMGHGLAAIAAARTITVHHGDAVFDWTAMPRGVLDDAETMGRAVLTSLDAAGPTDIPFVSPALGVDVASFFVTPFSLAGADPVIFGTAEDSWGPTSSDDFTFMQSRLVERMSEDPWAPMRSYEWSLPERWDVGSATWESVFDPDDRWSGAYTCSSTP